MSRQGKEQGLSRHQPAGGRTVAGVGVILLVTVLLVGGTWRYTRDQIADNEARRLLAEISTVLPPSLYDNQPHQDSILLDTGGGQHLPVYRARRNGVPVAAVLTALAPEGYVGPIRLLVGIDADGRVLGVRVTAHTETAGIGDAVEKSDWSRGFAGLSMNAPPGPRWSLRADGGEFDAIAGATVSSRAVVGATRQTVQYFLTHREEVFAAPVATGSP